MVGLEVGVQVGRQEDIKQLLRSVGVTPCTVLEQ